MIMLVRLRQKGCVYESDISELFNDFVGWHAVRRTGAMGI